MPTPRVIDQPSCFRVGVAEGADIVPKRFIKPGAAQDGVAISSANTDDVLGVTTETILLGKSQSYQSSGKAIVESGAAVALHAIVMPDATGRAVTQTTTNTKAGRAMTAATAAGQPIEVELFTSR